MTSPNCPFTHDMPKHAFMAARATDSRSPCPALNALANHGFIPRDGKNAPFTQLIRAIQQVYGLSLPLCLMLAIPGYFTCGSLFPTPHLTLSNLNLHTFYSIEHDASLVHADAPTGSKRAPTTVDSELLEELLACIPKGEHGLSLEDYARARVQREAAYHSTKGHAVLDPVHEIVGKGEVAMAWLILQDESGVVPKERAEQWYGKEMLPEGWTKRREIGFLEVNSVTNKVGTLMENIRDEKSTSGSGSDSD